VAVVRWSICVAQGLDVGVQCSWDELSGGFRGGLGVVVAPPNAEVGPPNSPPKMKDAPYI